MPLPPFGGLSRDVDAVDTEVPERERPADRGDDGKQRDGVEESH